MLFLLCLGSSSQTTITLLGNGQFQPLLLWQRDPWLVALADNKDVGGAGSEFVTKSILDVDNIKASVVTFTVSDDTDTAHVTSTGDGTDVASIEFDEFGDLSGLEVQFHSVVGLD